MYQLVLLRHGQSEWNKSNQFTGWTDVNLTEQGRREAVEAAKLLAGEGLSFDIAYTSLLRRAIGTLWIVMEEMDLMWVPVRRSWRLNERHYGSLQGLNKAETAAKYGEEQVHIWRRSYDVQPPAIERDDERHPCHDPRYGHLPLPALPGGECLADVVDRMLPYWYDVIAPDVRAGKRVIIAAHGNSLRALVKYFDDVPIEEITRLNIPTGVPLVYELDKDLRSTGSRYLGDQDEIKKAMAAVAAQGKAK